MRSLAYAAAMLQRFASQAGDVRCGEQLPLLERRGEVSRPPARRMPETRPRALHRPARSREPRRAEIAHFRDAGRAPHQDDLVAAPRDRHRGTIATGERSGPSRRPVDGLRTRRRSRPTALPRAVRDSPTLASSRPPTMLSTIGPVARRRPASKRRIAASSSPRPLPPLSSGTRIPKAPVSARRLQSSTSKPFLLGTTDPLGARFDREQLREGVAQ